MNSKTILLKPILFSTILLSSLLFSCNDDDKNSPITPTTDDYSGLLTDISNNVVVKTYSTLATNSNLLLKAVKALKDSPSETTLAAAKTAWVNARQPWEQSEGFLFGPVDTEGIDPSIDSWPVNDADLKNVLSSNKSLTAEYINSLEGTLKGFHTIEFLLWGSSTKKNVSELTDREFQYLVACTEVLAGDTERLLGLWTTSGDKFAKILATAGKNKFYPSQKSALEELANGIIGIADEVGNGKINDPLAEENLTLEESRFSHNSKTDFANNIRSIQNIYSGVNGQGLSNLTAKKDASLDKQIQAEIQAAIDAIGSIPGTFTEAIPASSKTRAAAENAQKQVRNLQATLESKLKPIISTL